MFVYWSSQPENASQHPRYRVSSNPGALLAFFLHPKVEKIIHTKPHIIFLENISDTLHAIHAPNPRDATLDRWSIYPLPLFMHHADFFQNLPPSLVTRDTIYEFAHIKITFVFEIESLTSFLPWSTSSWLSGLLRILGKIQMKDFIVWICSSLH